eukprot:s339_g2.t4
MDPPLGAAEVVAVTDDTEGAGSDEDARAEESSAKTESVSDKMSMSSMSSEDRSKKLEDMVLEVLSKMMPTRPEIIRAVRAGRATFCCGRALRSSRGRTAGFHASFQTGKIDEFWSHSWHGSRWSKIVTLTYLHNGLIAPLIATVCATIAASLFVAGVLPMAFFEEAPALPWISQYPLVSYWAKATGFAVYCLVLLLWQRGKRIFLDTLCIKQDDRMWKALALLSMPALLKSSDSLLVLWDPTYTRRLWCCFEIAAFLHSRPAGQKPQIRVRPTLLGVGFISILVALASLLLTLAFVPAGRQANPQTNHQFSETCDRRILTICITKWFGSIDLFQDLMRSEVLACLTEQLATNILTYREFVVMSLPVFWHHLDTASEPLDWYLRPTDGHTACLHRELKALAREVLRGIGWSFAALPILFLVTSRLSCLLRRRIGQSNAAKICWDVLMICGILLVVITLFVAFLVLEQLCTLELPGLVGFDAILFSCAFLLFRYLPVPMRLKAQAVRKYEAWQLKLLFLLAFSSLYDGHGTDVAPSPEEMGAALDAAQEAEKGTPDAAAAIPDPRAVRADAEVVARLVVKDWLRSGLAAAAPPEAAPAPVPEPKAQEPKAAEPPAGPTQRMLQEQWLSEWPCGPKDLQMALVPASVLCSGIDSSLAEGQLAPTRLWLDASSDELYLQPLLPSGPASKLKSTSVTSITCTQNSAYDDDASLEVEINGDGGKNSLKFFSDGEGIEMLMAALTRDTRIMPGQLMD